jgi:hypothetical protein
VQWVEPWQEAAKWWFMIEAPSVVKWKNEAAVAALRQTLRKLLVVRFKQLPEAVLKQIDALDDVDKLNDALIQVVQIDTLDELKL